MRRVLIVLFAVAMVAAGCSGDDDDTASDAATTTAAPSSTAVVPESEQPVSSSTTTTTTTLPIREIGETVEIWEGATLTITSIEADVPDCGSTSPEVLHRDEERFVLIRGTFDNSAPVDAEGALAATLSEREDPDGRSYGDFYMLPAETEYPTEVQWCFIIPADMPSWTFTAPAPVLTIPDYPPAVWDVSI